MRVLGGPLLRVISRRHAGCSEGGGIVSKAAEFRQGAQLIESDVPNLVKVMR